MFLIIAAILGIICALIAHGKGRSAIGWFFIGFFLGLIGLILSIVMPNLKEQREKEEQMKMEQKRLEEQLRQERIKNERFQQYANRRLDAHDQTLDMDTKQLNGEASWRIMRMVEGQQAGSPGGALDVSDVHAAESNGVNNPDVLSEHGVGWYYRDRQENRGPMTLRQIRQYIAAGIIQRSTYVWHQTFPNWMPAGEIDLFDFGDAV